MPRELSDLQRLAYAFQDIADEQRERARQERQCAFDTQNAMGITLQLDDISEMLKLIEKFARGGMHHVDMVIEANAFLLRHQPVSMPPPVNYKGGNDDEE